MRDKAGNLMPDNDFKFKWKFRMKVQAEQHVLQPSVPAPPIADVPALVEPLHQDERLRLGTVSKLGQDDEAELAS